MNDLPPDNRDQQLHHMPRELIDWVSKPISRFFQVETAAAGILLGVTVLALLIANSPWSDIYKTLWQVEFGFTLGHFSFHLTLLEWINDAVMTIFFFLVSLELKRELVLGELRQPRYALLSVSAAIGGMVVPAVIYGAVLWNKPGINGWGMVMATDTAFVIGCLALVSRRIPLQLRIFLLSLAIVDDIGAIVVVAVGYGDSLNFLPLAYAAICLLIIRLMALSGIRSLILYFCMGGAVWIAIEHSGIHPTVTGVILGLMTPAVKWVSDDRLHQILVNVVAHPAGQNWSGNTLARLRLRTAEAAAREALSPVERLEILLHPWVGFLIMPLFAFANAGVQFSAMELASPIVLTIVLSLVVGKPLGIFLFSWVAVYANIAVRPAQLSWGLITAGGCLCGIGFTMALFIAGLAFSPLQLNEAKFGILIASILSALIGLMLIKMITTTSRTD